MSKYLPHPELNHFYVGLLVVKCWPSVLIYSRWFWRGEAHRRFALVVCDCALDVMATVGVSAIIVLRYVDQYNYELVGFNFDLLADDNWVAQMLNEAQMILVVSWSDLAMRVVFPLGLIITTTNMKELLRYKPRSKHRLVPVVTLQACAGRNIVLTDPLVSDGAQRLMPPLTVGSNHKISDCNTRFLKQNSTIKETIVPIPTRLNHFHGVHILFALWGFAVLVLHIQAVMNTPLAE